MLWSLNSYCFGRFSFLMQPLEAAVILNLFDHVEFLISAALWSVYVSKHDGLILLGMWVSVMPLSPLLPRV